MIREKYTYLPRFVTGMFRWLTMLLFNFLWPGYISAQQPQCELAPGVESQHISVPDGEKLPFSEAILYDKGTNFEEALIKIDTLMMKISDNADHDIRKDAFWICVKSEQIAINEIVLQINDPDRTLQPAFTIYRPYYRSQYNNMICFALKFDSTKHYDKTFRICAKLDGSQMIALSTKMSYLKNVFFRFAINRLQKPSRDFSIEREVFSLGRDGYKILKADYLKLNEEYRDLRVGYKELLSKYDRLLSRNDTLSLIVDESKHALDRERSSLRKYLPPVVITGLGILGGLELIYADYSYDDHLRAISLSSNLAKYNEYDDYKNQRRLGRTLLCTSALATVVWYGDERLKILPEKPIWFNVGLRVLVTAAGGACMYKYLFK